MRWISHQRAAGQFGANTSFIARLVHHKVLNERVEDGKRQVSLEEGADRETLLEQHYAARSPCNTADALGAMRDVVALFARRRDPPLPPQGFVRDAIAYMRREGIEIGIEQLQAMTGTSPQHARRAVLDLVVTENGSVEETREHFRFTPGEHEARVLARLPAEVREAPGTYRCPSHGHPDDRPCEKLFARLAAIRNERLFVASALAIFRMCETDIAERTQNFYLAEMQKIDRHADGRGMDDPFVIRERLETVLGAGWPDLSEAGGSRFLTVSTYSEVYELIEAYIQTVVPMSLKAIFSRHQLVLPAGHAKFFGKVKHGVVEHRKAGTASRQSRIENILDHPLEFLLVGRLRLQEHVELRDACRTKIEKFIKRGKPLAKPQTFQHPYVTRLINDRFRRCEQTAHFRLWTWDLIYQALNVVRLASGERPYVPDPRMKELVGRDAYAIEFLGVTPRHPGGPTQAPLVAEVADAGLLTQMSSHDPDQLKRRLAACKKWEFSIRRPCHPKGVGGFAHSQNMTARNANQLLTSSKPNGSCGRLLLIPLEEFTHALMYAHASVFITADAGSRAFEVLQAPADPRKYETNTHEKTGDIFKEYDAISKNDKAVKALMSPDTFKYLTDLIVECARRWHGGRAAPAMVPISMLKRKKVPTGRYAFCVSDRMIQEADLGTFHRLLYLGWHGLRGHDVRHLFAALGRRAGISREVRQQLLNHTKPGTTDTYGPATPAEVSNQQMELHRHRCETMEQLRDSTAGEASAEMRHADIEMRRAELNRRFYQDHGLSNEADAMLADIDRWATELARATAAQTGGDQVINVDAI